MITLTNISISYGNKPILTNSSLKVNSGEICCLVGRNGAGKSTLIRHIIGLSSLKQGCGQIEICGQNITKMSAETLAKTIGYVSTKQVRVANLTCEDMVAMGRAPYTNWIGKMQDIDRQIVAACLGKVAMSDFAKRNITTLSDGECQRIMIARALATQTPILILDEPTAFLDIPTRYQICSLLATLAHEDGKTILYSTHDIDVALSTCDSVAVIDNQKIKKVAATDATATLNSIFNIDIKNGAQK